jgi:predicted transposase/invertase (TIGR01784 family)
MEFVMKYIRARDFLPYAEIIAPQLKSIEQLVGPDYIVTTINYIMKTGNISDPDAFFELIRKELSPAVKEKIMTVEEYLIQKGVQRGKETGKIEEARHIALKLHNHGCNLTFISEITGLSIKEIIQLQTTQEQVE